MSDLVAGLVLTGGSSRRMGTDKARLRVDGVVLAEHVAHVVASTARPALEVGPGVSGLPSVVEEPVGEGPLVALVCGASVLQREGHDGAVLVVACDLPFLQPEGLLEIVRWPTAASVLPVVDGRAQPLCARWSADDLEVARKLVGEGFRRMRDLVAATRPLQVTVGIETKTLDARQLVDLDSPSDLQRFGGGRVVERPAF